MATAVAQDAATSQTTEAAQVAQTAAVADAQPTKEASPQAADTKSEAPADANAKAEPAKSQAPEKYEFKAGNGEAYDAEAAKDFSEFAKQNGLTQEAAQTALASAEKLVAAHNAKAFEAAVEKWEAETRTDREIGGVKLTESLALAKKGIEAFATPGLQKLLKHPSEGGIGWGNHRDVIATFAAIARRISPDGFVAGKQAAPVSVPFEKAFYDKSQMN